MLAFTSDQWIIIALVFLLGLLVGAFLFAGSGRKWKTRYREESRRREEVEDNHRRREKEWDERERDLLAGDTGRGTVVHDRDRDGDGIRNRIDRNPNRPNSRYPTGRDADRDGIRNRHDRDVDGDGIRNRRDRDRDNDGVRNRRDRFDRNPNRR
jgi:hypothetical protein